MSPGPGPPVVRQVMKELHDHQLMPATESRPSAASTSLAPVALGVGALGIFSAVWAYWLVIPGVVFGIAGLLLGLRVRRREPALGAAAIALSVVALFLVPSLLHVVDEAESWGRHCALSPANPDC